MKKNLLFTIFAFCCFTFGFSQADCANALTLTPGVAQSGDSTGQAGDFPNAGGAPENPCNANYNDDEYWFEYTATADGETLQLDVTNITQTWAGIFVLDDCPSGAPNCVADATNNGATTDLSLTTPNLTMGVSYKIVISSYGTPDNTAFTLSSTVIAPPTCLEPTNLNAMALAGDVTAALSWDAEANASLGYNWAVMDAGDDPDVDTPVDSGSTTMLTATAMGLTAGNTYDLYVQSNCDTDGLSVWAGPFNFLSLLPPANDLCANAEAISIPTDGSCLDFSITTSAANEDAEELNSCDGGANFGVWYSFTGPASGQIEFESITGTPGVVIYEGACGTLTEVAGSCLNNTGGIITGLVDGNPYYAMVWTDTALATVEFCLKEKLCAAPTATATVTEDCAMSQFTIDVDITDLGDATSLTISNDAGVAATTGIVAAGMVTVGPFPISTPVEITVEHDDNADCNLVVGSYVDGCPPANDNFSGAIAIDCSSGTVSGSTSGATLDEDDAPDGGGADLDAPNLWYSLDSSVDGASDVTLDLCGSGYDTSVLVYTGTSGNLTFVAANDDNTAASACGACCQSYLTFPTDGTSTYYITVEGYNVGNTGDFDMIVSCVTATPAPGNDDCGSAVALSENMPVIGTTVGATTSLGDAPTCDTFGSIADVWYSVAITGGTSNLSVTTTLGTTSDQANVAVYDDCAALAANSLGCSDANGGETLDINNLANGTYYIRVWSDGNAPPVTNPGRIEGEFTIVVNTTLSTGDVNNPAAFTYYPNPVENTLTLKAQNTIENVAMYNMLGQEVLKATPNNVDSELDMSNLQDGTYFVKVTIANITKTIRVIKH